LKTTQSLKSEPRIKPENNIGCILCKVDAWKWPFARQKRIKTKPRIYELFAFDLDSDANSLKTKQRSD